MSVIDTLRALAVTIRNEKKKEANSSIRVGDLFLAIIEFIRGVQSGQIRQEGVDTFNDTSAGKTSLLSSYPDPEKGWTVLVRNDETNNGRATLYQWNGYNWIDLETVVFNDDVLSKQDIINDVTTGGTNVPLSAEQGKVLKTSITALDTVFLKPASVVNNLTTGGANVPLAAEMGLYVTPKSHNLQMQPLQVKSGLKFNPTMQEYVSYHSNFPVDTGAVKYKACMFRCSGNTSLKIEGSFNANVHPAIYLDKHKKMLGYVSTGFSGSSLEITTPTGTEYIVVNVFNSNVTVTLLADMAITPLNIEHFNESMGIIPSGYDIARILGVNVHNGMSGYIQISGIPSQSTATETYYTDYIYIPKGKELHYKVRLLNENTYIAFYTLSKKLVKVINAEGLEYKILTGSIIGGNKDEDIYFARFTTMDKFGMSLWYNEALPFDAIQSPDVSFAEQEDLQNAEIMQYPSLNLAATHNASVRGDENMYNYLMYHQGEGAYNDNIMTTGFIPIQAGIEYQTIYRAAGTMGVVFFDEFRRFKRGFDVSNPIEGWASTGGVFKVAEGEAFVRICGWNDTPIILSPLTTVVLDRNIQKNNIYFGKKLVTIGDSISQGKMWQEWLCMLTGLVWDREENDKGKGTHWELLPDRIRLDEYQEGAVKRKNTPTALSGTAVRGVYSADQTDWDNPVWQAGNKGSSIFERAKDVRYYKPDVIVIWAGANDHGTGEDIIGNNTQPAYMGEEVLKTSPEAVNVTSYASYKGMLQRLCIDNPNAKIFCLSLLPWRYTSNEEAQSYMVYQRQINTMIEDCAKEYHCEYVNLFDNIGWNYWNNHTNYGAIGSGSNREVHPNYTGQLKAAQQIARYLK